MRIQPIVHELMKLDRGDTKQIPMGAILMVVVMHIQQHGQQIRVCVHSSNAGILAALRTPDPDHRQRLTQQIEDLMVSYLEPHVGDQRSDM